MSHEVFFWFCQVWSHQIYDLSEFLPVAKTQADKPRHTPAQFHTAQFVPYKDTELITLSFHRILEVPFVDRKK